jgi:hypothetical protein
MATKLCHIVGNTAIAAAGTAIAHGLRDMIAGVETPVMPDIVFVCPKVTAVTPHVATSLLAYNANVTVGHSDAPNARAHDIVMMRIHSMMAVFQGLVNNCVDIIVDATPRTSVWALTAINQNTDCDNRKKCYVSFVEDGALNITLNVYKDSARSILVATGTRNGTGNLALVATSGHTLAGTVTVTQNGAAITDATIEICTSRYGGNIGTTREKYCHIVKSLSITNGAAPADGLINPTLELANVAAIPTFAYAIAKAANLATTGQSVTTTPLAIGGIQFEHGTGAPLVHDVFLAFFNSLFTQSSAVTKYIQVSQNAVIANGAGTAINPALLENGVAVAPDIVLPINKTGLGAEVGYVAAALAAGAITIQHNGGAPANFDVVFIRIPSILRDV